MAVYSDRERFIPYQKFELVNMVVQDLPEQQKREFRRFCEILESIFHFKFHKKLEHLKQSYFPFNPDKDTVKIRRFSKAERKACEEKLVESFIEILNDANYKQIEQDELEESLVRESLFKISLYVNFEHFDKCLLFSRGSFLSKTTFRKWFFKKEEIEIDTYRRIAMLIKFKEEDHFTPEQRKRMFFRPGTMIIKLFKNIPKADMEMLFPNTEVRMKLKDKLLLGIPAFIGGILILFTKGSAIWYAIPILFAIFYAYAKQGGDVSSISGADMASLIAAGVALGAILAYGWRQVGKYRSRKIEFMKTLSENLYFKNLDNNIGVFHHIIDTAEEEECKEAILGYYFLLKYPAGITEEDLDDRIEQWFEEKHGIRIDFEVDDALRKLKEFELCTQQQQNNKITYHAVALPQACKRLDFLWDNYFQYNN